MRPMEDYQKTGYLTEPFQIFYLQDSSKKDFQLHYHDFHKILIFLKGNVTYFIEGKNYLLSPYDVVLVKAGEIHKPVIHDDSPYERLIIYLSPAFFQIPEYAPLEDCFQNSALLNSNVIHLVNTSTYPTLATKQQESVLHSISSLKMLFDTSVHETTWKFFETISTETDSKLFENAAPNTASSLLALHKKIHLLDFLFHLNIYIHTDKNTFEPEYISNPKVLQTINFINHHITEELSIDRIANAMFLHRSYLMHLFKEETGYSIMKYIERKRLFLATSLIQSGLSKTEACYQSGFKNYAAYYYASKNTSKTSD